MNSKRLFGFIGLLIFTGLMANLSYQVTNENRFIALCVFVLFFINSFDVISLIPRDIKQDG